MLLLIEVHYVHQEETKKLMEMTNDLYEPISKKELYAILDNKLPTRRSLIRSASTGAIRGAIMGMLLYGVEGAVTGGIVFAIVNPIIIGCEHLV